MSASSAGVSHLLQAVGWRCGVMRDVACPRMADPSLAR